MNDTCSVSEIIPVLKKKNVTFRLNLIYLFILVNSSKLFLKVGFLVFQWYINLSELFNAKSILVEEQ